MLDDLLDSESLDDLDDLLGESVKLQEARQALKKRKHGYTLDPELAELLQQSNIAHTWVPEYSIARFVEEHCLCGSSHRRFDGWFVRSRHTRDHSAFRYTRAPDHQDLPSYQYTALEEVSFCAECVAVFDLPDAETADLTGLDALGQSCRCPCEQQELPLFDYPSEEPQECESLI